MFLYLTAVSPDAHLAKTQTDKTELSSVALDYGGICEELLKSNKTHNTLNLIIILTI